MTVRDKLHRERSGAARAGAEELLRAIPSTDILARLSLESQLQDLREETDAPEPIDTQASVALFFGGRPVVGQVGIESEFAGAALASFQDLVTKVYTDLRGELGQRGPLALKQQASLHVTGVVRGSFGFVLEEVDPQVHLMDTSLKAAVRSTASLLGTFYNADEGEVQQSLEIFDQRVVSAVASFFSVLANNQAELRILADETDREFRSEGIARAEGVARNSAVEEEHETLEGTLLAVLPEGHIFEFRADGFDDAFRGKVVASVPDDTLIRVNAKMTNVRSTAIFNTKKVMRNGQVVRVVRTLTALYDNDDEDQLLVLPTQG